jgi:hypothetical protein
MMLASSRGRALLKVVEHLVAGDAPRPGNRKSLLQLRHVEVAHTEVPDLPGMLELEEGADRVPERMGSRPVQQVQIETVGA